MTALESVFKSAYRRRMTSPLPQRDRLARMKFRSWHRGTREADYMIGGFFDSFHAQWDEEDMAWFEALLDEDDVDIMAWALQTRPPPPGFEGRQLEKMRKLDYVSI